MIQKKNMFEVKNKNQKIPFKTSQRDAAYGGQPKPSWMPRGLKKQEELLTAHGSHAPVQCACAHEHVCLHVCASAVPVSTCV